MVDLRWATVFLVLLLRVFPHGEDEGACYSRILSCLHSSASFVVIEDGNEVGIGRPEFVGVDAGVEAVFSGAVVGGSTIVEVYVLPGGGLEPGVEAEESS